MISLDALAPRWPEISALLDEVLALPAAERMRWVEALAGDRAELKDALRELLAARVQVETDDFLQTLPPLKPPRDAAPPGARPPVAGDAVGPYRLIAELGRGGMGSVWLAERADGQLKRRVALKLPHLNWSAALGERLARERDILASLAHPNIARLYDAGVDPQGRPYLAMEYVEGQAIDVHCRERTLPLRARLALLRQVCDAVAHAHARLVVHRDLKPSNILVTADGQVRLLDFGIAKLMEGDHTAETALTQLSGRALTLDYASPEQIRGEPLSTASDVYSLAVVAYELLAGARPYRLRRGSAAELEEAIASIDPPRASDAAIEPALKKQLRGDLDAILNKALKKNSAERYATVEAFSQDLQRHLAQQPVLAQPDRLGYRAGKFVRRHRLQVAAGSVAALALVLGAGVAFWQAHEASLQAERARIEAATAKAVQDFIEAVFRANSGDQTDPQKARDTTARQLLDLGAQRIEHELRGAPEARLRLLKTLADMYQGMALHDQTEALQRQRVALARQTLGPRSPQAAQALADLAYVLSFTNQRKEATETVTEAVTILDAIGDRSSPERLSVDLTLALLNTRSDFAASLAAADRAVANARTRPPSPELVLALQLQGEVATYSGLHEKARGAALEIIRLVEAQPALGANILSPMFILLAEAQLGLGELDAAEDSFRKAVSLARERNAGAPIYIHSAERVYANFLRRHGRLRESVDTSRPAYAWARSVKGQFGIMPPALATDHAFTLIAYGRIDEGLTALEESASLLDGVEQAPEVINKIDLVRAQGLIEQGRYAQAEAAIARARAFYASVRIGPVPLLSATQRLLQAATGRADLALRELQAMRIQQGQDATPKSDEPARALAESAGLHLGAGHIEAARKQAEQAIASLERDRSRPYLSEVEAQATQVLGLALLRQGEIASAQPLLERSLALHKTVYDPERSLAVADALLALGQAQHAQAQAAAAARSITEARRIHATHRGVGKHHHLAFATVKPHRGK
jgi:hypothetical protein